MNRIGLTPHTVTKCAILTNLGQDVITGQIDRQIIGAKSTLLMSRMEGKSAPKPIQEYQGVNYGKT